ncbi:MAG: flagellar hook-length control protein FliK [Halothiobacillaceae bacterium]|nr:MAG: flagellar hook-length control protein FliK [Halothiobacillaceae bacterium]
MSPIMPDLLGLGTAQPRLNLTGAATPAQAQPVANAWKVGEILQATVLGVTGGGMTRLDINGLEVSSKAPLPLMAGDRLELQVTQPGPPPQLRITQHQSAEPAPLDQALRQALPRGGDSQRFARLAEALDTLGQSSNLTSHQRDALRQLQEALPNLRQLTDPARLEQQMRASGLFLESDLAKGAPQPGDLKAALLKVAAALQNKAAAPEQAATPPAGMTAKGQPGATLPAGAGVPPATGETASTAMHASRAGPHGPTGGESAQNAPAQARASGLDTPAMPQAAASAQLADALKGAVEGALARLHLNQITSLQTQDGERPVWVMELPLPASEGQTPLRLRLERDTDREGSGRASAQQGWRLDLDFSMEPLGPLRASVLMRTESLNVRIWAERPDTLAQLRDHLQLLHSGLRRTGLEVEHLACYPGQPAARDDDTPRPRGGLLNLSA